MTKTTKRIGRPSWTPNLPLVQKMAALGLTNNQIADSLGINRSTFYRKKQEIKEFKESFERGRSQGLVIVASKMMEEIQNGNVQLIKLYLTTRAGWTTIPLPVIEAGSLNLEGMSAADIRELLSTSHRQ